MNVWLALAHQVHPHHATAIAWGEALDDDSRFYFCRFSQLGLLRLLTNEAAMGIDVVTQSEAWGIYDLFFKNERTFFIDEPRDLEVKMRSRTASDQSSTKECSDAYLVSFAEAAGLRFVTFDKALAARAKGAVLLRA